MEPTTLVEQMRADRASVAGEIANALNPVLDALYAAKVLVTADGDLGPFWDLERTVTRVQDEITQGQVTRALVDDLTDAMASMRFARLPDDQDEGTNPMRDATARMAQVLVSLGALVCFDSLIRSTDQQAPVVGE